MAALPPLSAYTTPSWGDTRCILHICKRESDIGDTSRLVNLMVEVARAARQVVDDEQCVIIINKLFENNKVIRILYSDD